jgi:Uma2 family endonuclease
MSSQVLPDISVRVPTVPSRGPDTATPTIGFASAGLIMTPAEFDAIEVCDELYRYELIHGVLIVSPLPSASESTPNDELGFLLREYRYRHSQGASLDETMPERHVRTSEGRRRADRVIWAGLGRLPDLETDIPTIVVEFVSTSRRDWHRDYVEKRREYREVGVKEYWIVDRFRRTLTVYCNQASSETETVLGERETHRTDLLPGFGLPLARLLAVADQWTK